MASWTKLKSGDWGITVSGSVKVGQMIEVKSKGGKVKSVKVVRIVWSGNGKSICAIEQAARDTGRNEGWRGNGCSACRAKGDWCDRCAFDEFDM